MLTKSLPSRRPYFNFAILVGLDFIIETNKQKFENLQKISQLIALKFKIPWI